MKRTEINAALRAFAKSSLTPKPAERAMVSAVYQAVADCLGAANCLQIGSYPRFTSVSPVHDLDVLYDLGPRQPGHDDPSQALTALKADLDSRFANPTPHSVLISRQTHSITLTFKKGAEDIFGVDVVPAYEVDTNDLNDPSYVVPEIATRSHRERSHVQDEVDAGRRQMQWITSDPRGYIEVARQVNDGNSDFRKAVKIAKAWRAACKARDDNFPLKSFHIEQNITRRFIQNPGLDIFGAVFEFFVGLPDMIMTPQIPDRADHSRMIDAYIAGLNHKEKQAIIQARDHFLIELEEISAATGVEALLTGGERRRADVAEQYLFDFGIPAFIESTFTVVGEVKAATGFRAMILDKIGKIWIDRHIEFKLGNDAPGDVDLFKWKVKNSDDAPQPRGEITDHRTKNAVEHTKFKGSHYVVCYAIKGGVCVARGLQPVVLDGPYAAAR